MKAGFAALLVMCGGAHAMAAPVDGDWMVKKRDVAIRIAPCADRAETRCGTILWVDPHAAQQRDEFNDDPSLRERPLCGVRVLDGLSSDDDGHYNGTLYKANGGGHYRAELFRNADGALRVRAYVGTPLLGKTLYLTPLAQGQYVGCSLAESAGPPAAHK